MPAMRVVRVGDAAGFAASARPAPREADERAAAAIVEAVRRGGDAAVRRYERRFGGRAAAARPLRLGRREVEEAYRAAPPRALAAVREAAKRLARSERALLSAVRRPVAVGAGGATVTRRLEPLASAGCYVPGGRASYPSSAVMTVTPARVAGVGRIAVATPPAASGGADPLTVAAADMCGATEIYRMGGAQAVAALAYGTGSVRPVDKIAGPGGPFVTAAKALVSRHVAIDMLAGPTELCIVADSSADARRAAADVVSQAEHGPDAFCCVITDSAEKAAEIAAEVDRAAAAARRSGDVLASLRGSGFVAVCRDMGHAVELANLLAPEHLQVSARGAAALARRITAAGLVLVGERTPSAASDYLLGSNHVLPTGGSARARGALSVLDFVRLGTSVAAARGCMRGISRHAAALAEAEGLPGHYGAVEARL